MVPRAPNQHSATAQCQSTLQVVPPNTAGLSSVRRGKAADNEAVHPLPSAAVGREAAGVAVGLIDKIVVPNPIRKGGRRQIALYFGWRQE